MNLYANVHQNIESFPVSISIFVFGSPSEIVEVNSASGFSETVTIGDDGSVEIEVPSSLSMSGTGTNNQGIKISSEGNITAYLSNRERASTDLSVIFEEASLGSSYVLASASDAFGDGGQFSAQAIADGTELSFTLRRSRSGRT